MARSSLKILGRAAFLIFIAPALLSGQSDLDAVRPFVGLGGPGGRAGGLGQAYTGVADDITALYYNPAGLAHLTRKEINLGVTYQYATTDFSSPRFSEAATITATNLSNAGFAIPIAPSKLTVALGYHQVRTFERQRARMFDDTIDDTTFTVKERIAEEGYLAAFSLGVGYQVSTQLAVGGSVDILSGQNDYTETDTFTTRSGNKYIDIFNIKPSYTGIGLTLGLLMAPLPQWRIGLLLRSPRWIKVNEEYSDIFSEGPESRDYSTHSSYSVRLGSSLSAGPLLFTGDLFWFDYSQVRFKSEIYDSTIVPGSNIHIDIPINDTLRTRYSDALGYAAGAELLLPGINAKLRAGYRNDPPINRNSPSSMTQHTFALGLSIVPVPQIRIDATYSLTHWERDYNPEEHEDNSAGNVTVNFVYRF